MNLKLIESMKPFVLFLVAISCVTNLYAQQTGNDFSAEGERTLSADSIITGDAHMTASTARCPK